MSKLKTFLLRYLLHNSWFIILGSLLVVLYFLSRLINLTIIPVFADEAIYIRWAQVMRAVASLRFLPLSDGKQPLFMWLIIPFLKIFSDPLVAGRMVSVLAGFGSMIGVGVLCYLLFGKKEVSLFAMILYLISPFTFFFDRLALSDGLLSFLGIWIMVGAVALVREKRLDLAMITGILLGLALITKSPALFFALLLPT
ncbi:MAG: ArnT family glycosyltransferase, partial [Microgenomates group bacterium]